MSEPEDEEDDEEEDMPEDKDSSLLSGVGDEEVHVKEREDEDEEAEEEEEEEERHGDEEEDSDGDFFDAGEGATIDDRVSSHAASKSGQGEDTEDDPLGPMTPGPITTPTIVASSTPVKPKAPAKSHAHAVSFLRSVSTSTEGEGDLDDEEWVDPTSVPATPLDATPPSKAVFQKRSDTAAAPVPRPPGIAKTKSSSSNGGKSRKHRKEAERAPAISASVSVPFPTSSPPSTPLSSQTAAGKGAAAVGGPGGDDGEDISRGIPQMSTARARDCGRTQMGCVNGV